jgi:hypothetical protein
VLPVLVLAFAGCGSSNKAATTARAGVTTISIPRPTPAPPATTGAPTAGSIVHTVRLAGVINTFAGARKGSGTAVITVRTSSGDLCWQFSQLKGFIAPLLAGIRRGPAAKTTPAIVFGFYKPSGCISVGAGLLKQLVAEPQAFYVIIENVRGAMQGRL